MEGKKMSRTVRLELPDDVYSAVERTAQVTGKTPAEWITTAICQGLPVRDDRLRRHFGAVNLGAPTGVDNDGIDADLAREYGSPPEEGES